MASYLSCPYLDGFVELTEEREKHIEAQHPDLLPQYRQWFERTLADPDRILRSIQATNAHLFSRWYDDIRGGKHVVVVTMSERGSSRHWVITAYLARRLAAGDTVWERN